MTHETNTTNVIERIPVFYSGKMDANISSFSPSAGKPARVIGSWQRFGLPIDIIDPTPVSANDFKLVHRPDFVNQVLACESRNGFGNRLPEVAASLPY